MSSLFEEIKAIRMRNAAEIPQLVKLVLAALSQVKKLKPTHIEIAHRGRNYVLLKAKVSSTTRTPRPFREDLFEYDEKAFLNTKSK